MAYNPDYIPTGANNRVNDYYKTINHSRINRLGCNRQRFLVPVPPIPRPTPVTLPADVPGLPAGDYQLAGPVTIREITLYFLWKGSDLYVGIDLDADPMDDLKPDAFAAVVVGGVANTDIPAPSIPLLKQAAADLGWVE